MGGGWRDGGRDHIYIYYILSILQTVPERTPGKLPNNARKQGRIAMVRFQPNKKNFARYSKAVDKLCLAVLGGSGDMYLATTEGY